LGERRFIEDDWRFIRDANFIDMDAFLPCPKNNQTAYIFSNEMYILIHIGPGTFWAFQPTWMLNCLFPEANSDRLISGPTKIEDDWRPNSLLSME
jgi:hypothetical protein